MKFHKLIHHILITIGLALGIIATGTTVNAKAQQLNPNNTTNNTPSSNQNINNNQIQNSNSVLINVPQQNQTTYSNNASGQANSENNDSASYVQNNNNNYYAQTNQHQSSSQSNISTLLESNLNSLNNFNSNQFRSTSNNASNTANHIYKNILSENENHFNDNKGINNAVKSSSQNSAKASQSKIHSRKLRLSAVPGKSNQNSLQSTKISHQKRHLWFRDGLSRQNLKARSWVSWHESNHRWRVLSYGGVCVGYFQLNPSYLGYKHGHVNLSKRHQVKVADAYVKGRYGNWINAKHFWETHHWY